MNLPDSVNPKDPKAPWNEPDGWMGCCCESCGRETVLNERGICEDCFYEREAEEDELSKGDRYEEAGSTGKSY